MIKVHFRSGIGGDAKITETAYAILHDLDDLNQLVRSKCGSLEQALSQLEDYQQQMQNLRQKIIHEEQQLRLVLAPTYLPNDRDKAITEQQVSRFSFFFFFADLVPYQIPKNKFKTHFFSNNRLVIETVA